jgi:hypothetical protein
MLVFKCREVVAIGPVETRSYARKNGQMVNDCTARLNVVGVGGQCAEVVIRRDNPDGIKLELAKYVAGKPAEVPIKYATALRATGSFRDAGIEYIG